MGEEGNSGKIREGATKAKGEDIVESLKFYVRIPKSFAQEFLELESFSFCLSSMKFFSVGTCMCNSRVVGKL